MANASPQFALIIFCSVTQVSDVIKTFSGEKRKVAAVEKVEHITFCKRGMSVTFRESRLVDTEQAVSV